MLTTARVPARRGAIRSMMAALAMVVAITATVASARGARADSSASLVSMTNSARASAGLPGLSVSSDLVAVARRQAARMAASHTLAHTPNLPQAVCCWRALGENVGEGSSASVLQSAFMASPEHRANILSASYSQIGIGVAVDAKGVMWVSEIFRGPSGAVPPPPAPKPQPAATHAASPKPVVHSSSAVTRKPIVPAPKRAIVAGGRASRDLAAGRLPLSAAQKLAAQIAASALHAGDSAPDPVSRLLSFAALSAGIAGY